LIDLAPSDLPPPLQEFQAIPLTREGLRKHCRTLNSKLSRRRQTSLSLDKAFRSRWNSLASILKTRSGVEVVGPSEATRIASLREFTEGLEHLALQISQREFNVRTTQTEQVFYQH
jgi:hypothetical protein